MKTSNVDWPLMFEMWEKSGLTQPEFCKENGLALSTFYYRRKQLKQKTPEPVGFQEITVAPKNAEIFCVSVDNAGNIRLRFNLEFNVTV